MDWSHFPQPLNLRGKSLSAPVKQATRSFNHNPWSALHRYACEKYQAWDSLLAERWYQYSWLPTVPQFTPEGATCGCQTHWAELTAKLPPDFSSPEAFFEWTVDRHNDVSVMHSNKPTMLMQEAEGLYEVPWIQRKPRAIVTLAIDDHLKVLALTKPMMQAYADRAGAELIVIDTDFSPHYKMANKWRAPRIAYCYDQTLYVDSDVLLMPKAPDIFAEVPTGFAVRDERLDYDVPNWYVKEVADLFQSQGVEYETDRCVNGGVLLMTPETRMLYGEPLCKPYPQLWCTDQHWLNYRLGTTEQQVTWLDDRWNWGFIRKDWWKGLSEAFFIHLNGSRPLGYRLKLAKRLITGDFRKIDPPDSGDWKPKHD